MAVKETRRDAESGGLMRSFGEVFTDQTTLVLLLAVLAAVGGIVSYLSGQRERVVTALARENAAAIASSVEAFQELYAAEVEKRLTGLRNNPSVAPALVGLPTSATLAEALE